MKTVGMTQKVVQLGTVLSCDGTLSFPVGNPSTFISNHLTKAVQEKRFLGVSSSFQVRSYSLQIRAGTLYYIGLS